MEPSNELYPNDYFTPLQAKFIKTMISKADK